MSYIVYKLMHFFGIFILVMALAATCYHALRGGARKDRPFRRIRGTAHGVALLLILTGGFGMLARLGIVQGGLPGWIWLKLGIWVVLGGLVSLAYLGRRWAVGIVVAVPLLAMAAAATALYKPL